MASTVTFETVDEPATHSLGAALAEVLPGGAVVALIGPLGAGKTRLIRAVTEAAGVAKGAVASPTFVLVHEYQGRVPIFHLDVYRLRDEDEFLALGPEEYFSQPGWSFVEWADRVADCLPHERLEILIEPVGPNARRFTIRAAGEKYDQVIEALRNALPQVRSTR
jgi:tRNA threonylcarbamoyladenosine biosynthesis protein TsaE